MLELSPVRQKELHKNISRTPRSIKKGEVRKNERKKTLVITPKPISFMAMILPYQYYTIQLYGYTMAECYCCTTFYIVLIFGQNFCVMYFENHFIFIYYLYLFIFSQFKYIFEFPFLEVFFCYSIIEVEAWRNKSYQLHPLTPSLRVQCMLNSSQCLYIANKIESTKPLIKIMLNFIQCLYVNNISNLFLFTFLTAIFLIYVLSPLEPETNFQRYMK